MSKFKIDDRVRCIYPKHGTVPADAVGIVVEASPPHYRVKWDKIRGRFWKDNIVPMEVRMLELLPIPYNPIVLHPKRKLVLDA